MTKCDLISNAQLEKEQKELKEKFTYAYNLCSNDDFFEILQTHWERVGLCHLYQMWQFNEQFNEYDPIDVARAVIDGKFYYNDDYFAINSDNNYDLTSYSQNEIYQLKVDLLDEIFEDSDAWINILDVEED